MWAFRLQRDLGDSCWFADDPGAISLGGLNREAKGKATSAGPRFSPAGLFHKSMTTSLVGCEQQTRRFPSAGFSSGSGP